MSWPRFLALGALVVAMPLLAQDSTQRVQFARGASSKAITGSLRGYAGINYLVSARAGQALGVSMRTSNASAHFNIWAPGANEAMFIGSQQADGHFSERISVTGDYRVQVYLMRSAARRNERATYTLTIGVTD